MSGKEIVLLKTTCMYFIYFLSCTHYTYYTLGTHYLFFSTLSYTCVTRSGTRVHVPGVMY
jgi:hypothetical protein